MISKQMDDCLNVKETQTNVLSLIQAHLYASFGGFSVREILERGRI